MAIDGHPIKGLSLDEAANRLQGTEGTTRRPRTSSDATAPPAAISLVRRHVDVESVAKVKMVDAGRRHRLSPAHRVSRSPRPSEIDQAVEALASQGMRVLVIDLRGNPGGLLNVAVEIAERFIDSGLIVSTRGRAQGQTQALSTPRAGPGGGCRCMSWSITKAPAPAKSWPVRSKITSRATILGSRTYGKGSVQSIFSLRSAPAGLKLTTAKFYSPLNRPYSEQGVQPDIPITVRTAAKPAGAAPPPAKARRSATPTATSSSPPRSAPPGNARSRHSKAFERLRNAKQDLRFRASRAFARTRVFT